MRQFLNIKIIPLAHIDFTDISYMISPDSEPVLDESFKASISRYGTFSPPVVRETDTNRYSIVAGRKRLRAVSALQTHMEWPCLVISRQVPEIEVFRILLDEITLARQLTPVEKAHILQKVSEVAGESQIVEEFLPIMGLAPNRMTITQTVRLLDLELPILLALHQGTIHETVGRELTSLTAEDRTALFEIISSLQLSYSNQKKILAMGKELAGRHKTTIANLLDDDAIQDILQHQEANPPQKTKKLMRYLSRKHFPRSSMAEEEFNNFTSAMHLPQNVTIEHAPYFENDSMTLSITFPDRESLKNNWEKMRHVIRPKND